MDPIFGLPCITDSKAMDSARTRNQSQEKKLADRFNELDIDMKSRSFKILTKRTDVEDFKTNIDSSTPRLRTLPLGLSREEKEQYKQLLRSSNSVSMTLSELDKRLADRRNKNVLASVETSTGATCHNDLQHEQYSEQIVDVCQWNSCLSINRQKHAARNAWSRATSDDIKYKNGGSKKQKTTNFTAFQKHH
ncbi:hypothetical protein Btru_006752 [Bulinus truncatus]|nr:hypothetical protein Btru_006752 [Bulinus truncatus]